MAKENREKGLLRYFKIDRASIDKENRTVPLSFASESPVERWAEQEVLSHDRGDYDFERINSGNHPLLLGHDERDPSSLIGVVMADTAKVSDKTSRCVVRFGTSPKANEIFDDVCNGIRTNISVGYDRTGIVKSDKAKDGMVTTRYKWMPTHVAIVNVPADTSVGVLRDNSSTEIDSPEQLNVQEIVKKLNPEQRNNMRILLDPAAAASGGGISTAEKQPTRAEIEKELTARRKEIRGIGKGIIEKNPHTREAVEAIMDEADNETSMSIGDFRAKAFEKALAVPLPKPLTMSARGVPEKDRKGYRIMRIIQESIKNNYERVPKTGIEREWHEEMEKELGGSVTAGGCFIPYDAPVRNGKGITLCRDDGSDDARMAREISVGMGRDLTVGQFNTGGAFVATILETPVIEVLRNKMVLPRRGVISLGGLNSNISIPRQTAAATAYSLAEQGLVTVSNQAIDQISLTPHRISFQGRYSRMLLIQSSVDVEGFIRDDALKVLALKNDYLGMFGGGNADESTGIFNQPGISSITFGGAPSFYAIVSMETALAALNADVGNLAYVTSAAARGILKSQAKVLTGATQVVQIAIWEGQDAEGEGMMNGYTAAASNQMLNNVCGFADWSSVIMGLFGGLDIIVDPYTQAGEATNVITMNMFSDFALRHAQSVCISTDSAAQ